jgi:hypothetical protein
MTGWMLESIEIEGLRGINNEGDPLTLRFKADCVCSISAPNGVGKSSIFDAISFAIRGSIPKLDGLPASEGSQGYYVNRFHSAGEGKVVLTLVPDGGGSAVAITVQRKADGSRTVTAPPGVNGSGILSQLDREFVLLDHKTFQSFIDDKDLDRGRSFAGLLGLKKYSDLRQELQSLSNTRGFNTHFSTAAIDQRRRTADSEVVKHERAVKKAFEELTKKSLADHAAPDKAHDAAHFALHQIVLLQPHCTGKRFGEIDFDGCVTTIKAAEGGEDRGKLAELVTAQSTLEAAIADGLTDADRDALSALARKRDDALAEVGSALLCQHFQLAEKVLSQESWTDKNVCPTCETHNEASVLEKVHRGLSPYQAVEDLAGQIDTLWDERNWTSLVSLEKLAFESGEDAAVAELSGKLAEHSLAASQVSQIWDLRKRYSERLASRLAKVKEERSEIEKRLPPSLVEVTTSVEAAKRLRDSWKALATAQTDSAMAKAEQDRVSRVKRFLDKAASVCATAESNASMRRLAAVQPLCETLFAAIIHDPVKPALAKRRDSEDLSLLLSKFWTLSDVSAQALLSESFRNAFAVSVYLAAAKLYGGDARFMVLDDVTSSFDAGHQFHLMEVIRTKFARPGQPDGPQAILLSHDTLLEKLFNKNANGPDWQHVRLEGTARTAVLPQSNAGNRVRDATLRFLNAGQVEDGALRLRQYLEYKLLEVIGRVNIPVPIDFALDDTKKQVQSALDAIQAAVALHQAAGSIALTAQQQAGLQAHVASITGNFLTHYATGSTQAFSGSSLLGVVKAIDDYAECFMHEDPPSSGTLRFYRSLSRR